MTEGRAPSARKTRNNSSTGHLYTLSSKQENQVSPEGESDQAKLERLGRQRPEKLGSLWQEIGFVFSIAVSQLINEYFVSGFTILLPTVAEALEIPASSSTWPASAFSLVISSFLLPFGRIADMYGGFPVYLSGCLWCAIWSLIAGFARNQLMLDICRALQGLGPAAYLPAGLQLLGSMYRPGPRKNLIFSIYAAMAPLGFFVGIFFAGVAGQFATWRWYFFIGSIIVAIATVVAWFAVPSDMEEHKGNDVKMDWLGSLTTTVGLILLVFAITDSSHAPSGWTTPYILVTFILGLIIIGVAFYVEGWIAEQPLLPFEAFKAKSVRPFALGLIFVYGTLGIYLLYASLYCLRILGVGQFQLVAWYAPAGTLGIILAICGGFVLHIVHPLVLMAITSLAIIVESVLFALAPPDANYWAWIFVPMICSTIAVDFIFNVANIFFTSQLPARQQGLAGALSNVLLQLGIALLLGFAEIVATQTADQGLRRSYQNVFWFNLACGATALVVFMGVVRIERAKSDLTADEREALNEDEVQET
ncbi:MFS-type transporter [Lecanosticta acicola]|uniref:MFS-type transporter n=1 Tax=Lecanosticta acicola TaxID=111012 RepID=A0AAI8Z2B2_9PEZI|nr:MFS-type transporter [Lecanosticta acicola]